MDLGWIVTYASPTNPTAQKSILPGDALKGEQIRPYLTAEVQDVDAAHAAAVARGYDVVHPLTDEPWEVRRFFVVEPGGLVLNVLAQPPAPTASNPCLLIGDFITDRLAFQPLELGRWTASPT